MRDTPGVLAYPLLQQLLCTMPLLLLLIVLYVRFHGDIGAVEYFEKYRTVHPGISIAINAFSAYGNVPFYGAYLLLGWRGVRSRDKSEIRFVAAYCCAVCAALSVSYILKFTVGRPRPPVEWDYFVPFSTDTSLHSFPSGHVTGALIEVTPLAQRYGRIVLPLLCGLHPALMGLSRIYMGMHWPSDMAGSVVVGGLGCFLCWWLAGRMLH